jgi:ElaB/YqjD/DUF883 family membrane-anchored ribosome-binding protein
METRHENAQSTAEATAATAEKLIADLKTMIQRAEEKAVERAKAADRVIRDHPYHTVGVAFAVGVLLGVLCRRK